MRDTVIVILLAITEGGTLKCLSLIWLKITMYFVSLKEVYVPILSLIRERLLKEFPHSYELNLGVKPTVD